MTRRNSSIIVSLLTIQVVTVLFVVVSAFLWLLPALPADDHGAGKIYIAYVAPSITKLSTIPSRNSILRT
jgi:hypothetical protein